MSESYHYVGSELELFREAVNWKRTLSRYIRPYLRGNVLEVGSGIGGTTEILRTGSEIGWTCLEPDAELHSIASSRIRNATMINGTLRDLPTDAKFDSILYIDVLEHIDNDKQEMAEATSRLNPKVY